MLNTKLNPLLKTVIHSQYRNDLNYQNIEKLRRWQIKRIFKNEDRKIRDWYLRSVINEWNNYQENDSRLTYIKLKKIIKKCQLKLSGIEKHRLFQQEERIFMTERHLKKLDTFVNLPKNEFVYANFHRMTLYELQTAYKNRNDEIHAVTKGNLLITNKRFLIEDEGDAPNKSFMFSQLQEYTYKRYGFQFKLKNKIYVLRIHDYKSLNNIISLIFRKKAKNVIKKYNNN